jgi:hypothetical protein
MARKEYLLHILAEEMAICRLEPQSPLPDWATWSEFVNVSRTRNELSIVCGAERVPSDVKADRGWRALQVAGPLAFSEIGILAALSGVLAEARVSVFAVSTYDTDYLLVKNDDLALARRALTDAGHSLDSIEIHTLPD